MLGLSDRRVSVDARALQVSPPEEMQAEQRAVTLLERTAVFSMTFGPGAAIATYTTLFGWYQKSYDSRELLVWMRIALFAPFPIMKMLQYRYDTYVDKLYGTSTAYLFRIVVMQLVVAALMVIWMFLPHELSESSELIPVVAFGVVLGSCAAPFIGSSVQIAVAIDPILLVWAQLGNTAGMSMPVIAEYAMGFSPDSDITAVRKVIAVPLVICIIVSLWLALLHHADIFGDAYRAIADRRQASEPQSIDQFANPQDEEVSSRLPDSRDSNLQSTHGTESRDADLQVVDDSKIPLWVWCWFGMQSFGIALDFFMLALIGYFGNPQTTHHLAAFTLLSGTMGRLLALPFRSLQAFHDGPMHITGTTLFLCRISCWSVLLLSICKFWKPSFNVLTAIWIVWNLFCMVHNSLTDMTVTSNVAAAKRQVVAQMGLTMSYSALFLGLVVASAIVLSTDESKLSGHLGSN